MRWSSRSTLQVQPQQSRLHRAIRVSDCTKDAATSPLATRGVGRLYVLTWLGSSRVWRCILAGASFLVLLGPASECMFMPMRLYINIGARDPERQGAAAPPVSTGGRLAFYSLALQA
eukprot:12065983-Alexandrium_andersonii.AAC.1